MAFVDYNGNNILPNSKSVIYRHPINNIIYKGSTDETLSEIGILYFIGDNSEKILPIKYNNLKRKSKLFVNVSDSYSEMILNIHLYDRYDTLVKTYKIESIYGAIKRNASHIYLLEDDFEQILSDLNGNHIFIYCSGLQSNNEGIFEIEGLFIEYYYD